MYVYLYFSRSVIQAVPDVLPAAGLPVALHPARQSHLLVAEAQQEGAQTGQCPERDRSEAQRPRSISLVNGVSQRSSLCREVIQDFPAASS